MASPMRLVLVVSATAMASALGGQSSAWGDSVNPCDDWWRWVTLYRSGGNPILQEFALQGRVHLQYATGHSDQGDFSSGDLSDDLRWGDVDVRRIYAGFKATLFEDLKINAQALVNADWGPVYGGLHEVFGTWTVNDQCQIGLGKYEIKFGREFEISSKEIPAIERSLLLNQVAGITKDLPGAVACGSFSSPTLALGDRWKSIQVTLTTPVAGGPGGRLKGWNLSTPRRRG